MHNGPPPLFKQGAPARVKVTVFTLVALALLIADTRIHTLQHARYAINLVLHPLQRMALLPRDAAFKVGEYFSTLSEQEEEIRELRKQQIENALVLQQAQQLIKENAHLRSMLAMQERAGVKSVLAEILYDARDAFTRKIILNRGSQHGVMQGQPVIDDNGVVGQVTRVFPFNSEVTLLTDQQHAIPVQVVRNGLRTVAYGRGQSGVLELRFVANSADILEGDVLVTSGVDGVYPAGLSVARVIQVETPSTSMFGRILCLPLGGVDRNRQLLVLLIDMNIEPRPLEETGTRAERRRRAAEAAKNKELVK